MQQQVVGPARVQQVPVVVRKVLGPGIGGLDEDLRVVPGAAEHTPDPEDLVSNGVAVSERGEDLMDTWPVWLAKEPLRSAHTS